MNFTAQFLLSERGQNGDSAVRSTEEANYAHKLSEQATRDTLNTFLSEGEKTPPPKVYYQRMIRSTFNFFDDAQSSRPAFVFSIYFIVLILFSTLTFCLQTIVHLDKTATQLHTWDVIETIVIAQFTSDYLIRICSCPKLSSFVIAPLNIIDLVAILPFWIELIITLTSSSSSTISGLAVVRVLRVLRVLRLFKLAKSSGSLKLVAAALYRSREGIFLLLFLMGLATVFFASAIFYAETAYCDFDEVERLWIYNNQTMVPGVPTTYQSIVNSFWWCAVTITTVGYGDSYPVTPPGKAVASVTIVVAVLVVAFPITIIGSNLSEVYEEFRKAEAEKKRVEDLRRATKNQMKAKNKAAQNVDMLVYNPAHIARSLRNTFAQIDETMVVLEDRLKLLKESRQLIEDLRDNLTIYAELQAMITARDQKK